MSLISQERLLHQKDICTARLQGEFDWTRSFQGHVLSSYFYGYIATVFLGGLLAGRYGGKHVLGMAILVSSLVTLLIPPAVRLNEYLIIVLRVVVGAASVSCCCCCCWWWYCYFGKYILMACSLPFSHFSHELNFITI
jgi:MFS family permease